MLLSKYGLDCQPFNKDHTSATWENCSLRAWLNDEFINTAFSDTEKAWISLTSLANPDNPEEGTSGGNDTADKVFILSLDEAVNTEYGFSGEYGTADKLRQCAPT
ncbi:MAG: hypothetical protein J6X34_07845 [Clostridia bacterium]|nr:hypothetical protein [Clostridia bacterium]